MEYLKIRNWDKWQTYRKDRGQPPWIKIHRQLMRNVEWVSLTDAERGQLVAIWLLGADHDGVIPASPELIQKLCYMTKPPDLNKFTDLGFIENGWRQHGVKLTRQSRDRDRILLASLVVCARHARARRHMCRHFFRIIFRREEKTDSDATIECPKKSLNGRTRDD